MAQTKPKAAQFYGVTGHGTAGQVLVSDGNGGMSWGSNTEQFTVSWATPTGQSLTYTQPSPQSSSGASGASFPTTTFTATKSGEEISGTATIAGLPTGITATQSLSGTGVDNVLTVTLTGVFPGADSLNTALTLSGLTVQVPLTVDYLVVAAGGGGGGIGGGGGAGGYRTSYGDSSVSPLTLNPSTNYTVTVGAGGAQSATGAAWNGDGGIGANGGNTVFSTITSAGGGGGGSSNTAGKDGGSGGGSRFSTPGSGNIPSVTPSQGNSGGDAASASGYIGGGGGGASQSGNTVNNNGGNGSANSITGTSVTYSGGGGGGGNTGGSPPYNEGVGGTGGGANSGANAGTVNTGGGGGGGTWTNNASTTTQRGGAGGSGIVILRYPNTFTVTIGSGLTGTTATTGSDKITTLTAGTGNIQFN